MFSKFIKLSKTVWTRLVNNTEESRYKIQKIDWYYRIAIQVRKIKIREKKKID